MEEDWKSLLLQLRDRIARKATLPISDTDQQESPSNPIAINIGIDFGTSYTKTCFRDAGTEQSGIIKFKDTAIIPSLIKISSQGKLYMGHHTAPSDCYDIKYLKMRLAGVPIDDKLPTIQGIDLAQNNTCRALSAWFLANVLKESCLYLQKAEANRLRNRRIFWSANIGVPVEHYDSPALSVFEEVLAVAWRWNIKGILPEQLEQITRLYEEEKKIINPDDTDFHAVPEIAAAVHSFVISRSAVPGFYVFFDIGGGTVDGVAFKYRNDDGSRYIDFYSGRVESIGLEVFQKQQSNLKQKLQQLVGYVVITAKQKDGRNWQLDSIQDDTFRRRLGNLRERDMRPLIVFLGGYGANNQWYRNSIKETYRDFGHNNAGIPPYALLNVTPPNDFYLGENEFSRFTIAYGLSVPYGEGPEVALPSVFDYPERPQQQRASGVVDYADSKDVYD